jgi:hypothetical protein
METGSSTGTGPEAGTGPGPASGTGKASGTGTAPGTVTAPDARATTGTVTGLGLGTSTSTSTSTTTGAVGPGPVTDVAGAGLVVRARTAALAVARGFVLTLATLAGSLTLFVLCLVSICLIPIGVGLVTIPAVLHLVRLHANRRRLLAAEWAGVRIQVPYAPFPERTHSGVTGLVRRGLFMLKDPATWRDLAWLPADMTAGTVLAILPPGLVTEGVFGVLLSLGLWMPMVHRA